MVSGIMGALFHRARTGEGQMVSTSLLRAGVYSIGMDVATRIGFGRASSPQSRQRPQNPLMNSYRAADGGWFWLVGAESQRHWPGVAAALGCPELVDDPRFNAPRERRRHAETMVKIFEDLIAQRSRAEWAEIFREHDVWWAPINSIDDIMTDPQLVAAGAYVQVPGRPATELPEGWNSVATPVDFSRTQVGPMGPPPEIGADADALLGEIGIDAEEIARLRASGVLAPAPTAAP
jgi:crotonobetainyl-CoA:carnitine CoA-transferase CaiB-like acyl-CoA transferase